MNRRDILRSAASAALLGRLTPAEAQHVHQHAAAAKPKAGAPEFIDTLCSGNDKLKDIFTGGLAWIDAAMKRRTGKPCIDAPMDAHTGLLDSIAYRGNMSAELDPGIRFFDWARRLVVDAWTTSPEGVTALGYMGNKGQTVFQVPAEAITWALAHSPLKDA